MVAGLGFELESGLLNIESIYGGNGDIVGYLRGICGAAH
ncbi:hypothetical protein HMPREF9278_1220 [Mobiluncus mulieris FB024-16]|nr:hypothetical protein HMPREF9278_1220 [Mobiluncus mulieris FB024-16]